VWRAVFLWGALCLVASCGRLGFDSVANVAADAPADGTVVTPPDGTPDATLRTITFKEIATQTIPQMGATSVTLPGLATAAPGDVLIATIAMGNSANTNLTTFTPPTPDWTLIRRLDATTQTTLIAYWHVVTGPEPMSYTWSFTDNIEGVAWVACYAGVNRQAPIEADDGVVMLSGGPMYAVPSITTVSPNAVVVATFTSHSLNGVTTWSPPPGTTPRLDLNNGTTRSGLTVQATPGAPGPTGTLTATASTTQDYALAHVFALAPGP
jgi:hypothetical protein